MSGFHGDKCDQCGKRTDDRYEEMGWIQLEYAAISISLKRQRGGQHDRQARTAFRGSSGRSRHLDFCCVQCMVKWLQVLAGKEMVKRRMKGELWQEMVKVDDISSLIPAEEG
jgi:hypothetical protein